MSGKEMVLKLGIGKQQMTNKLGSSNPKNITKFKLSKDFDFEKIIRASVNTPEYKSLKKDVDDLGQRIEKP